MEYLPSYTDDLYLEHHGILGQKWGVRRYQNEDGTLTEAGEKRLKKAEKYAMKKTDKKYKNVDLTKDSKALAQYDKDFIDAYNKKLNQIDKTAKLKTALKIGGAAAAIALTAYGAYKLGNLNKSTPQSFDFSPQSNRSNKLSELNRISNEINKQRGIYTQNQSNGVANSTRISARNTATKASDPSNFTWQRARRVDARGNVSSINVPTDREGYARSFATEMSKGNSKEYNYWYRYMINKI